MDCIKVNIVTDQPANFDLRAIAETVRHLPAIQIGALELKTRYLISPLAKYTNLSFRRIIRSVGGVGLATTDLVNARGLVAGNRRSMDLIATTDDRYATCGSNFRP